MIDIIGYIGGVLGTLLIARGGIKVVKGLKKKPTERIINKKESEMQLTENFSLREFRCKDGTDVPEEYMDNVRLLCENLQVLRDEIGKPIRIISGYRSKKYNTRIGGARKSQHMTAKAGDLKVSGMKPSEVKEVIVRLIKEGRMHPGGIGLYKTFTHYDVRGRNARWYGKGAKDDRS
tara:strand:+ start:1776 stop:2306 length:531 start_codon:yes stop_codon:yes gene_type:complete